MAETPLHELSAALIAEELQKRGVNLYSICERRNGKETVLKFTPASRCHNSYSVAKAFTVTAVGMMVDDGKLSTDTRVYDLLRPHFPADHDKRWEEVTLHNLLTHRIGLEHGFLDIDTEDVNTYGTQDYLRYAFSQPLPAPVGASYKYSDAAYYILSRAVAEAAGEDMRVLLQKRLFNPMQFREVAWSVCPHGYAIGATGLYISSADMAKLGQLYLDGGMWKGHRLVSENWVNTVFSRGYELTRRSTRSTQRDSYGKGGMYGQMLYLSRSEGLVLAWHAFDKTHAAQAIMEEWGM